MESPKLRQNKRNYLDLAFLLPVLGMLVFMFIRQIKPFGTYSMLYSDQYHQYYPFFVAYRKALLSGDSLLYSWDVGMGMDYLGLISYYLASPLNLLSILVPENWLLEFFSLLVPVRIGLASLFFAIFLNKVFRKNDFSIVLFGCFYGTCAWALGYQWNVMWMDTFALLPLVVLGTVSLLKSRKFVLYTLTLFLAVFANYYIGLFVCIFVLLVFVCYEICRWKGWKRFLADLGCMALFSALAIGMTAILELPALAALQTTQSSVNTFPEGFRLNIVKTHTWVGLLDAMRQVAGNMNGGLTPTFKEGLPNLYCGVITIALSFLFLTSSRVRLRDKLCSVLMLVFFSLSFIIRQLDYVWHGFHFPNMIPYRFSFLYSFVMLYIAYRAYLLRHSFHLWQILIAAAFSVIILFCPNDLTDTVFWAYNGIFLLLYFTALFCLCARRILPKGADWKQRKKFRAECVSRRNWSGAILCSIMAVELIMNLVNFGVSFSRTSTTGYPRGTTYTASMIRYMQEREADNLFYRAEVTHSQTLNDGALNGYHGISTFTSSANVNVTEFMQALGYGAKNTYNRYCFEESSPISNLFLNLKYMLERDGDVEENAYFDDVHHYGDVHLLENNAYLPLGFLANTQLVNVDFSSKQSPLAFQDDLLTAASGVSGEYWTYMTADISSKVVPVNNSTQTGYCSYKTTDTSGIITYTYVANAEGLVCIDLNLSAKNSFSVWKNNVQLYSETYSLPQTLSVSNVVPGDTIEVRLTCKKNESGTIRINAGILNEALFREAYDVLAASTLELTTFRNTYIEGTIQCDRDGVLYTSIPQNGSWVAKVDGKPVETVEIGDAMVGLLLTEGEHTVTFSYENKAFSLGWKISLACFAIFAWLYVVVYKPKWNVLPKGKYQK